MKYRKKPIVIEAFKFIKKGFTNTNPHIPVWFVSAINDNTIRFHPDGFCIKTLEGNMIANDGDYIIQDIKGEIYPCKPDIFEATYEKVEG